MKAHLSEPQPFEVERPVLGLNDTSAVAHLVPGEATLAENVDFDRDTIANRRGRVRVGNAINADRIWGIWQFRKRNGDTELLAVADDKLFKYNPFTDTWAGAISGTPTGDGTDVFGGGVRLGCWGQWGDKVFYADGEKQSIYTGSAIFDWGHGLTQELPAGIIGNVTTIGRMTRGDYSFVYTYYDSTLGAETNPSAVSNEGTSPVTDNGYMEITIPANSEWTARWDTIRIYRTYADGGPLAGGAGEWFLEKEFGLPVGHDLSTLALTTALQPAAHLSVADSELDGASPANFGRGSIPKIRFFVINVDRFLASGDVDNPATVYWTQKNDPYGWDVLNAQYLDRDDGHPVTALFILYGRVYAWKRNGPGFQLAPHSLLTFSAQKYPTHHGCESHQGVVTIDNYAFFPDREGIIMFNGQQAQNISDPKIRRLWNTIALSDENYLPRISGGYDNQPDRPRARWVFGTNTGGVGDFSVLMTWRTVGQSRGRHAAFHVEKYGDTLGPQVVGWMEERGINIVLTGDNKGQIHRLRYDTNQDEVYWDEGRQIVFKWYSAWMGQGTTDQLLSRLDLEIERAPTSRGAESLTVKVWGDGEDVPYLTKTVPIWAYGEAVPAGLSQFYGPGSPRENPESYAVRVDLPARYTRRIRVGFELTSRNASLSIVKFLFWGVPVGPRLVGVA